MMRFQIRRRLTLTGYKWTWRLVAANGEPLCHGEHYSRKIDAMTAIELVQSSETAAIVEAKPTFRGMP